MQLGINRNVRAVMFDMGNVLVDLDVENGIRAFRQIGFESIGDFLDPCHQRGFFGRFESGLISKEEFCEECISRSNPGATPEMVGECINAMLAGIMPEKSVLLNKLKEHCDLYLLSNNNPIAMYYCGKMFADAGIPLETTFRQLFYSYKMKMMKPDPAFFRECIALSGCKPSEIVFVDDSKLNVDAALALGIDARLYVPRTDLSVVLEPVI